MNVKCSSCEKTLIKDIWAHLDFHEQETLYSYCPSCLDQLLKDVRTERSMVNLNAVSAV